MKILGETLVYPPTLENYKPEIITIGGQRRALDGSMDTYLRATKRRWTMKLVDPDGVLYASLIPYLDGSIVEFEDHDEEEYDTVLVGLVPTGFPPVQETTITLEEA